MKRELAKSLLSWKDSVGRQPLLIRGARQVGKTYLVEQFAKEKFDKLIKINFEQQSHYCECFESLDVKKIIQEIELNSNELIEPGKTLLFLDEIQECPNAIKSLRYFYEEFPQLHVIGAGSLLNSLLYQRITLVCRLVVCSFYIFIQ